jgi:hypothetical protein
MKAVQLWRDADCLTLSGIRDFYRNAPLDIPDCWKLSRKHFRAVLRDRQFVKLNKLWNRISLRELRYLCTKYTPYHVYMSVLDWLSPERVGHKRKANRAVPIGGEYLVDVDHHNVWKPHIHYENKVCPGCIENSRGSTLHICERIEQNYRDLQIVFSGRRGFHIHVLDFNVRDWTRYNESDPIKTHEVARFKYSKLLARQSYGFNRPHFIVASDPMRIVTVPCTLNAEGRLVCVYVGSKKDLETLEVEHLLDEARPYRYMDDYLVLKDFVHAHPEPSSLSKYLYPTPD